MSQGDKPGGGKKTQISSSIPPPPTVGGTGKGFPFPSPASKDKRKSGLGLPSFAPPPTKDAGKTARKPTGPVPLVPPAPPSGSFPTVPREPTVDFDDAPTKVSGPAATSSTAATPDHQRFDPLQMVDDDEDWMEKRPGDKVDEGAVTGRYQPVPEGDGFEDGPTKVHPGRKPPADEPVTTVYSKVLKKPGLEDAVTNRYPSVKKAGDKTPSRKATMMGAPGMGMPAPAPVTRPEPEPEPAPAAKAEPPPTPERSPVVTGHTQAMDAADAPPPSTPETAPPPTAAAQPAPASSPPAASAPVTTPTPAAAAAVRPAAVVPAAAPKRSSAGLIVGVVVGFAVVAGVGFAVATGGDGDEGSAQAAAADQVAAAAKAEPPPPVAAPEPEPAPTAAEAEPAPSEVDEPAPTEDPAQPETAEEAPEAAPEPEPEAEPEPESEPEPEPAPMPAPVEDESEYGKLVGEAVAALQANDHRRAYDVASRANDLEARNPSLEVMARAACHLGQNPDARKAYRGIVGATIRRRVNDECTGLGVKLQFKGDGWMPIELLALAEKALERGEYQQAFDYAQESHKGKRRSVAMSLMGQAQCGLKNGEEAQRYHDLVRPVDRPPIIDACKKHGVPIKEPEG